MSIKLKIKQTNLIDKSVVFVDFIPKKILVYQVFNGCRKCINLRYKTVFKINSKWH